MANTYELIASSTVGSGGASSVSFSSIPSTYTDLLVKSSARTLVSAVNEDLTITFNSASAGTWRALYGTGSAAGSTTNASIGFVGEATGNTATSNTFCNMEVYIPNYNSSNIKSMSVDSVTENNATENRCVLSTTNITNGTGITSMTFTPWSGTNFVQYTNFYLYGIKNS